MGCVVVAALAWPAAGTADHIETTATARVDRRDRVSGCERVTRSR
jgi:hypothetical protein